MEKVEYGNFEETMKELEEIAQELEKGELTLEQSVEKFERGMKLSSRCSTLLEEAEKKITMLVRNSTGEMEEQTFEEV